MSTSFQPRPEAHAMRWRDLLPPVRAAVSDLVTRLDGAVTTLGGEEVGEVATSFLVYGDRGSGKTTVLLSARSAVKNAEDFFGKDGGALEKNAATKEAANALSSAVEWLDLLDMDPLHPRTNLLTTLLVRLRSALMTRGKHSAEASLFEEGTNEVAGQLDRLIADASLMWEDIEEDDTRSRANRQIMAAETYASFRANFRKAIDAVASEVALRRGLGRDKTVTIILPIDNIDRSTDHLYAIFKLAQMVSCKHLLLVMAGDRVDIDLFLERAYGKELLQAKGGEAGAGKARFDGDDEVLSIARRQAAAASRKVLPNSHRIKVNRVTPYDALDFKPRGQPRTLRELFGRIPLWPLTEREKKAEGQRPWAPRTLLELIDVSDDGRFVENIKAIWRKGSSDEERFYLLTRAAGYALDISARGLLDLGQVALEAADCPDGGPGAVRVVRSMLRNAVAESSLPNWAAQRLQGLIRRNAERKTRVDLGAASLSLHGIRTLDHVLKSSGDAAAPGSEVCVRWYHEMDIRMEQLGEDKARAALPSNVAGWLMLLHDILIYAPDPLVWSGQKELLADNPRIVTTRHTFAVPDVGEVKIELPWPLPAWETFFDFDVMGLAWKTEIITLGDEFSDAPATRRLLADAWIGLIGWAAAATRHRWPTYVALDEKEGAPSPELCHERFRYDVDVRDKAMHDWFLKGLPLMFLPDLDTGLRLDRLKPADAAVLMPVWKQHATAIACERLSWIKRAVARQNLGKKAAKRLVRQIAARFDELTDPAFGKEFAISPLLG